MLAGLLVGATIALSPGAQAAQEPFCRPPPPQPRLTRMQAYQRTRRRYGFRADRAYIRSLIRRGLVFKVDVQRFPMTLRERRFLRLLDRIELGRRAYRYLYAHPAAYAGVEIEQAWPRGPFLVVLLARDRAKHARALLQLVRYPDHLRTRLVPLSKRALDRLTERIAPRAAKRDGFTLTTWGPLYDRGVVELELITKRTDATAYFRARYGPHVRVKVVATELYSPRCTNLLSYVADGTRLTIGWEAGGGAKLDHVEVAETDESVTVGVVVQSYNGPQTLESARADHVIELSRPLGSRKVIDATTGNPISPRRDPY